MSRFIRFPGIAPAAIAIIHAVAVGAHASEPAPPVGLKYTVPELVALAKSSSLLLGSQDLRIEEGRLAASQARAWPGLTVDLLTGRKRQSSEQGTRYDFGVTQPLPLAGKPRLRGRLLEIETEASGARRSASETALTLDVFQLAYEYAINRRKATFVEERRKRFGLIDSYLAGRVFASPQKKAESRIVQNRIISLAADVLQIQGGFKASFEKLRVFVPLERGAYPEVEIAWFAGAKTLDDTDWIAKGLERNSTVRLQRLAVQGAEVENSLASRDAWPEPSILARYEEVRTPDVEKTTGLGLSLALPSWNANRAGIKSAAAKSESERRFLGFEERRLNAEIAQALVEYEAARLTVAQYPQALLADLEKQLQEADAGFRKGQVDLLTFLELDGSAIEAFNRAFDAQLTLASKLAALWRLSGERDVTQLGSY